MNRFSVCASAAALALGGVAYGAQLNVQFSGLPGSNHDPDGGSFGVGSTRGGLFEVTINNTTGLSSSQLGGDIVTGNVFYSFCVEVTETLSAGNHNFDVNTQSIQGGASPLSPQPLVAQTAYLYKNFRMGTLTGFTALDNANVNGLQDAIWFFQNQLGVADVDDNNLVTLSAKAQSFVDLANTAVNGGSWVGISNVRILNLGSASADFPRQDLLALVPLPHGAGLAGIGLLGLATMRRRKSL